MTSGINERPYLSIGEVLGLLLEEFPDVTISKIRFLESQGLIEPERTASGYRKFFDADVERLRLILREQKQNFLPLRVIRERIETGAIDESGAIAGAVRDAVPVARLVPGDIGDVRAGHGASSGVFDLDDTGPISGRDDTGGIELDDPTGTISPQAHLVDTARHPAARRDVPGSIQDGDGDHTTSLRLVAAVGPSDVYDRTELCSLGGVTQTQLNELESFGLVSGRGTASSTTFTESDLAVVKAAAGFLQRGIDARHLRAWRQGAEREASLFEQRILPLLRQRNPQARQDAVGLLGELADLGAELRAALVVSLLRHHLDS